MDNLPKWKNYKATHCDNVSKLAPCVVWFQHFEVEHPQDGDTVDGEMGGGEKEAHDSRNDDGNKASRLFFEGHEGVGDGHCVGEQGYRCD